MENRLNLIKKKIQQMNVSDGGTHHVVAVDNLNVVSSNNELLLEFELSEIKNDPKYRFDLEHFMESVKNGGFTQYDITQTSIGINKIKQLSKFIKNILKESNQNYDDLDFTLIINGERYGDLKLEVLNSHKDKSKNEYYFDFTFTKNTVTV